MLVFCVIDNRQVSCLLGICKLCSADTDMLSAHMMSTGTQFNKARLLNRNGQDQGRPQR